MSVDQDFEQRLRRDLGAATRQPAVGPDLAATLRAGRGRRRRRAAGRVAGGVMLACAVGLAVVIGWPGSEPGGDDGSAPQWTTSVPPEDVNDRILDLVQDQLPAGVEPTDVSMKAWGPPPQPCDPSSPCETEAVGADAGGGALPPDRWDEADSWSVIVDLGPTHYIDVSLSHALSETEGDLADVCPERLPRGYLLRCETALDGDTGAEIVLEHAAWTDMDPGWMAADPEQTDPDRLWFDQQYEVQPGGDFLVRVDEIVKAPAYDEAQRAWVLDDDALSAIGLDGALVEAG